MNSKTTTRVLAAPQRRVFDFLSRVENLPRWATRFCRELKVVGGTHKVVTPEGELFFRLAADPKTGVIDLYAGPTEAQMAFWPTRVVSLGDERSAYVFTSFQWPGVPQERFEAQCRLLEEEFDELERLVS